MLLPHPPLPSSVGIPNLFFVLHTSSDREVTTLHCSLLYSGTVLLLESSSVCAVRVCLLPSEFSWVPSSSTLIFLEALEDISKSPRTFSFAKWPQFFIPHLAQFPGTMFGFFFHVFSFPSLSFCFLLPLISGHAEQNGFPNKC